MRDGVVEGSAVFALEPLDQREAIFDLLQAAGRGIDAVGEAAKGKRQVFELRLDAVAGVEVWREPRIDRRELAHALPHVAERGERRRLVVVQLRVALAA